jgi:hypothetical protein
VKTKQLSGIEASMAGLPNNVNVGDAVNYTSARFTLVHISSRKKERKEATGVVRRNSAQCDQRTKIEIDSMRNLPNIMVYSVYLFIPLRRTTSSNKLPHFFNRLQVICQLQIILLIGDKRPSETTATIFKPNRINFPLAW